VAAAGDIDLDVSLKRLEEWLTRPDTRVERTAPAADETPAPQPELNPSGLNRVNQGGR
jgi:hypothetical protein